MEEPPAHVKFILATTEVHKVPATIISRCQRFDFRRIKPEDIKARLLYIAEHESFTLDEDAADLIARISDGAMRDALSLLDQCVAYSSHVDINVVSEAGGIAGRDYLYELLECMATSNISRAIEITDELYSRSKDMGRLADELIFQTRNLMLIKTVPNRQELLSCSPAEIEKLSEISKLMSLDDILSKLEILQGLGESLIRAQSKRTELEMALVKLCRKTTPKGAAPSIDLSDINAKIARLEQRINALASGATVKPTPKTEEPKPIQRAENTQEPVAPPPIPAPIASNEPALPCAQWDEILERYAELNPGCASAMRGSVAYVKGDTLRIIVKNEFFLGLFKKPNNAASLKQAALEVTGISYKLMAKCQKAEDLPRDNPIDKLIEQARNADIPVEFN